MTFTVVPDKATGDTFTELMYDTYLRDNMNKGILAPIATFDVITPVASVVFSNIPSSDYTALVVIYSGRVDNNTSATGDYIRFNGDTSASYDVSRTTGVGTTTTGESFTNRNELFCMGLPALTAVADTYGPSLLIVGNPGSSTMYKNALMIQGIKASESTATQLYVAQSMSTWRKTEAISSISFTPAPTGNIVDGSKFDLYGIGGI